jgi:hypothetical protein
VERTLRQVKDDLRARFAGNRWPEHLPWVLFGLRAAPKEDSAISSAELVFGAPLTLPGQLLTPPEAPVEDVVEALRSAQPVAAQPLTYAETASGLQSLQRAEFVCVRKGGVVPPLSPCIRVRTGSWEGRRNSSNERSEVNPRSSAWTV